MNVDDLRLLNSGQAVFFGRCYVNRNGMGIDRVTCSSWCKPDVKYNLQAMIMVGAEVGTTAA
ncbi:MAG: hypothetical protein WCA63_03135 [Gallionella sp.]|jgi:hypothetical protein